MSRPRILSVPLYRFLKSAPFLAVLAALAAASFPAPATALPPEGAAWWPTRLELEIGHAPKGVVTGDFNADGLPDLAAALDSDDGVAVLLSRGGGVFAPGVFYPTGSYTHALAAADLDLNGTLDLVAVNSSSNNVRVLLGRGDGTFVDGGAYPAGGYPIAVSVGLLNQDAVPDLLVSNLEGDNISVLLGDGMGRFIPGVTETGIDGPFQTAIADFNGDHISDYAVASSFTDKVLILRGQGNGTFVRANEIPIATRPRTVRAADLDHDGDQDLVVVAWSSNKVAAVMNLNNAGFAPPSYYSTPVDGPNTAVVDFINGDGHLDIAVVGAATVAVLLGTGTGGFTNGGSFRTGNGACDVAVARLNGDAYPDIVTAESEASHLGLFLADTYCQYPTAPTLTAGDSPADVVAADFNGDEIPDLATANFWSDDVSVLLGEGDGTFGPQQRFAAGNGAFALAAGDLSGDGAIDLAVTDLNPGGVSILLGNGAGGFGAPTYLDVGQLTGSIEIADFDHNQIPDLVVTNANSATVAVLVGTGGGSFQAPLILSTGYGPLVVRTADLDHDGFLDLVVLREDGYVSTFRGGANATFTHFGDFYFGPGMDLMPITMDVGDINGDSQADAVVGFGYVTVLDILPGLGNGGFGTVETLPAGHSLRALQLHDMDEDGRLDVVVDGFDNNSAAIFYNAGGRLEPPTVWYGTDTDCRGFAVADLDLDGVRDLAVANWAPDRVTLLFGYDFAGPTGVQSAPLRPSTLTVAPNPVGPGGARIRFDLASPAGACLSVFDAAGRLVRTLAREPRGAVAHELEWNPGRDGVRSGVYFVTLRAGGRSETQRVVVVR